MSVKNPCMIWLEQKSGNFLGVKVYESSLEKTGTLLLKKYKSLKKVRELVRTGWTLKRLEPQVIDCEVVYSSDDIEKNVIKSADESVKYTDFIDHYFFKDEEWYYKKGFMIARLDRVCENII